MVRLWKAWPDSSGPSWACFATSGAWQAGAGRWRALRSSTTARSSNTSILSLLFQQLFERHGLRAVIAGRRRSNGGEACCGTQQLLLAHVPHTEVVVAADTQRLWDARRGLFFKPVAGYGSKAAYRGEKLTRRVWQDILAGDYVAQALVTPGERRVNNDEAARAMKFDLRAYAYDGAMQWVAARMYQGQATNFRTPGGGFSPVYSTADASGRTCPANSEAASDRQASYGVCSTRPELP